ncbi:hypothetical protein AYI69_g25 [Smittium culicis]|uniref:Uncharacterized protein n=1 Tax=Smittium culicis TaxID=133412 RepID=A0A1R1YUF5_9FUNG|nr:hypothetical protein AYI69_g25 [Smittium culicis]
MMPVSSLTILAALLFSASVFCNEDISSGLSDQKKYSELRNRRGFHVAVSNGESSIDDRDYSEKANIIDEFQDESNKSEPIRDNDDTPRKIIPEVKVPIFQRTVSAKLPQEQLVGPGGLPPKYAVGPGGLPPKYAEDFHQNMQLDQEDFHQNMQLDQVGFQQKMQLDQEGFHQIMQLDQEDFHQNK